MAGLLNILHIPSIHLLINPGGGLGVDGKDGLVGELLNKLSGFGQVIAITHLPQIAAQAPFHYQVEKQVSQNRTKTMIQKVNGESRVNALVKMLGGEETGTSLKKYAEELLIKFKS